MGARQYQLPRTKTPVQFQGLAQGFVFPVAQPLAPFAARQQPASSWTPIGGASVAAPAQSYVFPVQQPARRPTYSVRMRVRARTGTTPATSTEFSGLFAQGPQQAVLQPWQYPRRDADRPLFNVSVLVQQGAAVTSTLNDRPTIISLIDYWATRQPAPTTLLPPSGGSVAPVAVFQPSPESHTRLWYEQRPAPRLIVRDVRGQTAVIPNPPALGDGPTPVWWGQLDRWLAALRSGVTPQVQQGSTIQATYVFPLEGPSRSCWYVPRFAQFTAPPVRVEGATTQPSFVFLLAQPDLAYYRDKIAPRISGAPARTEGAITIAAAPQTYLFPLDPATRTNWYLPRVPSQQVAAPAQIQQGAPAVATAPIPPVTDRPAIGWWAWRYDGLTIGTSLVPSAYAVVVRFNAAWAMQANRFITWIPGADE